jgi:hypothetical protein
LKRKSFLATFLKALGAQKILWGSCDSEKIYGTVIYDEADQEERQEFVWKMSEENIPSSNVEKVIRFLAENNLISIDKIIQPIEELAIPFLSPEEKQLAFTELFNVTVNMVDNGIETDIYFIHN